MDTLSSTIRRIMTSMGVLSAAAASAIALGRDPQEVDAMVEELMKLRMQAYLRLHTIPDMKSQYKADAREIKKSAFANRRLEERRQISDRRAD